MEKIITIVLMVNWPEPEHNEKGALMVHVYIVARSAEDPLIIRLINAF